MALYRFLDLSGQVQIETCLPRTTLVHGYSKSQVALLKILHTISTIPPSQRPGVSLLDCCVHSSAGNSSQLDDVHDDSQSFSSHRTAIDLNLSLGLPSEAVAVGESESFAENENDASEIRNCGKDTNSDIAGFPAQSQAVRDKRVDVSEVTQLPMQQVQTRSFEVDPVDVGGLGHVKVKQNEENGGDYVDVRNDTEKAVYGNKRQNERDFGCESASGIRGPINHGFDLLIEAAKLISGTADELDSEETMSESELGRKSKAQATARSQDCNGKSRLEMNKESREGPKINMSDRCFDVEDHSPVVRSKRGRNQTLPYRYRDSVLEPWKRSGSGRQPPKRPSATTGSRKRVARS